MQKLDQVGIRAELVQAIHAQSGVRFEYEKADGEIGTRRGVPYELIVSKAGDELVRVWDLDRNASRSFRLDRITGEDVFVFDPSVLLDEEKWEAIKVMYLG